MAFHLCRTGMVITTLIWVSGLQADARPSSLANITLHLSWGTSRPDCVDRNSVVLVNHDFPAPVLRVKAGQLVHVTVQNHLEGVATTMHWHGFDQKGNPWADGAAGTSECPLGPGDEGTYSFVAPTQPGTHYYHGHVGLAKEAGAAGMVLVDPADGEAWPEAMRHDEDVPLFITDWYHGPALTLIEGILQPDFRWVGDPQSILVNGKGHFDCFDNKLYKCVNEICQKDGLTTCTAQQNPYWMSSGSETECKREYCPGFFEVNVSSGKTYLLRIANGASLEMFNIAIDRHQLTVVELDGEPIKPTNVSSLDLHAGQRAGIIVVMDQLPDVYWLNVAIRGRHREATAAGGVVLRYDGVAGAPLALRRQAVEATQPRWDDTEFSLSQQRSFEHPDAAGAPSDADVHRRIVLLATQEYFHHLRTDHVPPAETAGVNLIGEGSDRPENYCKDDGKGILRWAVARQAYHSPRTPMLHSLYYETASKQRFHEKHGQYFLEHNKTYDIVLANYPACNGACETHPWHLHGHHFWVVGTWPGEFNGTMPEKGSGGKLHRRDTVNIIGQGEEHQTGKNESCGFTIIRFVADNPGAWPFHCHIEWHQMMGMGVTFYYAPETIPAPKFFDDHRICGDVKLTHVLDKIALHRESRQPKIVVGFAVAIALFASVCGAVAMVALRWRRPKMKAIQESHLECGASSDS